MLESLQKKIWKLNAVTRFHVNTMWPPQNMTNFFPNNTVARGFLTPAYFMTVNIATPPL